jgi:hypothetical protein
MKTTLHTPGPWKCDLVSLKIWANDGNAEIARTSSDVSISEEEANARLIASAPDLLAILNEVCMQHDMGLNKIETSLYDIAKAALRKAKGEA